MNLSFLKSKTAKNAGWLIGGRVLRMLISFFVTVLSARYLGPSNLGLIGYATAYITFFMAFCTLGINSVLVKEFLDCPGQEGEILGTTLCLRAISSFCSAITVILIVLVVEADQPVAIWTVALSTLRMMFQIFEVFNYWFQSRLQSKITAASILTGYTITAFSKFALMIAGKSVVWFALVTAMEYFWAGLVLLVQYRRQGGGRLSFSWKRGKHLLSKSRHFILPSLMIAVYGQTDKLMLKHMIGQTEIGYYSSAVSVCNMWCFVLAAIITSAYPNIVKAHEVGQEMFQTRCRQLYAIVFHVSAMVSVVLFVFARPIVYLLYGPQFTGAIQPLRVLTWYTAFTYLGVARNAWVVCENRQKYLFRVSAAAAAANVIMNYLLIPVWGASGAAAASLIAQITTTVLAPLCIRQLRPNAVLILQAICWQGLGLRRNRK